MPCPTLHQSLLIFLELTSRTEDHLAPGYSKIGSHLRVFAHARRISISGIFAEVSQTHGLYSLPFVRVSSQQEGKK